MNIESLRLYCLSKKEVTESFPFDEDTLVFKVAGKMFALTSLENAVRVNLKCDPEYAQELRAEYPEAIYAGYHMNKKHWNTVVYEGGGLSTTFLKELIDHSYEMVVKKMKKADRVRLLGE